MGLLPFGFSALHLFLRYGECLADSIVHAFGFGVAGDGGSGKGLHCVFSITRFVFCKGGYFRSLKVGKSFPIFPDLLEFAEKQ